MLPVCFQWSLLLSYIHRVFGSLLVEDQDVDQVDFIRQFVEYVDGLCTGALQVHLYTGLQLNLRGSRVCVYITG